MPELGLGEFPVTITLLDVLDHISTHAQIASYVLNGHMLRKVQDVPFEPPDEASILVGKSDLDVTDRPAGPTLAALHSQSYDDLLEGKAGCSESSYPRFLS
jgi:hypothetical protein